MAIKTEEPEVLYPDSDGEPMADNTLQFEWIVTIKGGLEALFRTDSDVFVAGDLLWYPVRGDNRTRLAPDAMVAFGRPKGYRGSYQQWLENGIAPQVVFEVLSPGNSRAEMVRKRQWYERYGVEEYYEYDPDHGALAGWQRQGEQLIAVPEILGWISPRMGVKFDLDGTDLVLIGPNGKRFESFVQQVEKRELAEQLAGQAIERAEQAIERAEQAEERAQRLAARLRELGLSEE
jgi:Uma2 family endonuclease